jgi:TP901 family phage tail tape measure protein
MTNTVKWGISASIFNNISGSIQQAYYYVKDLDTALNDIRIVTGQSNDQMAAFAVNANKAAKDLSASTTDIAEAALIYYQQGDTDSDAMYKAQVTTKASNVTTGVDTQQMSDYLTAVWNGYQVANEAAEEGIGVYENYVDKLAAVAAATASDLGEVATGMSKVASTANIVGVSFDSLNAQISTIVSVAKQAPETVGNSLKTIYARIGDLKLGETLEDNVDLGTVSGALQDVGIQVLDASGKMRDMEDILSDIGNKWSDIDRGTQQALAQKLGGKYQYNNLMILFDNWTTQYQQALKVSQEAEGTLEEQQSIYADSLAAHLQTMSASWEDAADSFIGQNEKEDIKDIIDLVGDLGTGVATIFDSLGGGEGTLKLLIPLMGQLFSKQISNEINNLVTNFQNAKNNAKQLATELEITQNLAKSKGYSEGVINDIVDNTRNMQQYYSVLSEEQIDAHKKLVEQAADLGNQQLLWEELKTKAEEYGATISGQSFDITWESDSPDFIAVQDAVEGLAESYKDAEGWASQLKDTIHEIGYNIDISSDSEQYQKLAEIFNNVSKSVQILIDDEKVGVQETEALQKALEKIGDTSDLLSIGGLDLDKLQGMKDLSTILQNQAKEVKENTSNFKNMASAYSQESDKIKTKLEVVNQEMQTMKGAAKQAFDVKNLTTLATSLGSIAGGLQGLSNLKNILSNDDLTSFEKLFQILSNMAFTIPSIVSGVKNIKGTLLDMAKSNLFNEETFLKEDYSQKLLSAKTALEESEAAISEKTIAINEAKAASIAAENAELEKNNALLELNNLKHERATSIANTQALVRQAGEDGD